MTVERIKLQFTKCELEFDRGISFYCYQEQKLSIAAWEAFAQDTMFVADQNCLSDLEVVGYKMVAQVDSLDHIVGKFALVP